MCALVKEACINPVKEGDFEFCANYQRHYSCEKKIEYEEEVTELFKNDQPADNKDLMCQMMCLDGECSAIKKSKAEEDKDISQAVAIMNALKEAKNGISNDTLINIFKGEKKQCDKKLFSYMNCCSLSGGWGEILGASCGPEAKTITNDLRINEKIFSGVR